MEQILEFIVVLFKMLFVGLIDGLKALLPIGVLPRKEVKGDVALITGAGSGLGRLMAQEFGRLGATIVLWDINEAGNKETVQLLEKENITAHAYTVDLSDRESINATAKKVLSDIGRVDILVNNAGIVTGKKLFECPDGLMEKTVAVNTTAHFFTVKNFLPGMLERDHGHIVTIASMAGKAGVAGLVDYCASKHGAVGFHESLTSELRYLNKTGVHTTCVCPYYVDTGMFEGVTTKSPILLPILQPQYVVDNIMEATLTNKEYIIMPKFCYWAVFAYSFMPPRMFDLVANYYGTNDCMEQFVGRAKA